MKNQSKSMSRRGLGSSWSDLGGSGGVSGGIWAKNHEKKIKKQKLDLFGPFWAASGALGPPSGAQEAILGVSWASWNRFGEALGRFLEHF